jgi:hypothetical protein
VSSKVILQVARQIVLSNDRVAVAENRPQLLCLTREMSGILITINAINARTDKIQALVGKYIFQSEGRSHE